LCGLGEAACAGSLQRVPEGARREYPTSRRRQSEPPPTVPTQRLAAADIQPMSYHGGGAPPMLAKDSEYWNQLTQQQKVRLPPSRFVVLLLSPPPPSPPRADVFRPIVSLDNAAPCPIPRPAPRQLRVGGSIVCSPPHLNAVCVCFVQYAAMHLGWDDSGAMWDAGTLAPACELSWEVRLRC
jgi:hypothetical protein